MSTATYEARRDGWLRFAVIVLLVAATANGLYGVAGLVKDDHFARDELLFGDLSFWGGTSLAVASIQFMVALLIVKRVDSGVGLGILIAAINAVAQMMAVGAYPIWSVTILVIDALIIYGLTVYGVLKPPP